MKQLVRSVVICAPRETVFRFFTDGERFARWWGVGSTIDPRPGGALSIRYPDGTTAGGNVVELEAGKRILFTYGYDDPKKPIPRGGSQVEVVLDDVAGGTRVTLRHQGIVPDILAEHDAGWRFQLSLFAKAAAADAQAGATARVDAWFSAWSERDPEARRAQLSGVTDEIEFRDDYACIAGVDDLADHIRAAQQHLSARIERDGPIRQCQGSALVRWRAEGAGGGTNVFDFAPDGRICRVVGFWG